MLLTIQEFDIIFPPGNTVKKVQKSGNVQMPILPPLRTTDGILVPDLSGLRLRFVKHPDEKLTLSLGEFSIVIEWLMCSWRNCCEKRRKRYHYRRELLDVYD